MKYQITVQDKWGTLQIRTFTKGSSKIRNETHWGLCEIVVENKPDVDRLNALDGWSIYSELDPYDMDMSNNKSDEWIFSDDISESEKERILERISEEDYDFLESEEGWSEDMDIIVSAQIDVEEVE
jgi:hypothetical protein